MQYHRNLEFAAANTASAEHGSLAECNETAPAWAIKPQLTTWNYSIHININNLFDENCLA